MQEDRSLDFKRVDAHSPEFQHVVAAADQHQFVIEVQSCQVARMVRALRQFIAPDRYRFAEAVNGHHFAPILAADDDLTDLTDIAKISICVLDFDAMPGDRPPDRQRSSG